MERKVYLRLTGLDLIFEGDFDQPRCDEVMNCAITANDRIPTRENCWGKREHFLSMNDL